MIASRYSWVGLILGQSRPDSPPVSWIRKPSSLAASLFEVEKPALKIVRENPEIKTGGIHQVVCRRNFLPYNEISEAC